MGLILGLGVLALLVVASVLLVILWRAFIEWLWRTNDK